MRSLHPGVHGMNRRRAAATAMVVSLAVASSEVSGQAALTTWRATPVWRIDGTESGEPFFDLRDYLVGRDGTLWVLDFKDQVIRRFDANGKALGSVGRKGSGPGEMSNANGFVQRRDGTVWVNDPRNARFTVFNADGKFAQQHVVAIRGYGYRWGAWIDRTTGDLVDPFMNQAVGGSVKMDWRRVNASGGIRDTFPMPTCTSGTLPARAGYQAETKGKGSMYGSYPFSTGGGMAPDGEGGVWCASPGSLRVARVRIGANDTLAQTTLTLAPIPVPRAERDAAIASIEKRIAQYATTNFDASKIPSTKPAIASLTVDDDGRLWVQHAARWADASVTFDVHDKTGKHLGRLRIPFRPSAEGLPIRARGNDLWIALRDEDDVIGIARYRIGK